MTLFFSISLTFDGCARATGLGTLRCGQCKADQAENYSDHEGLTAMLARIEHHQATRVGSGASRLENEQIHGGEPDGPHFAPANGNERQYKAVERKGPGHDHGPRASVLREDERAALRVRMGIDRRGQPGVEG